MPGASFSCRKLRTCARNACSSSVNSRRMVAAGDRDCPHVVFCSTESNSEFVQNYEYGCRSMSMNKPHKLQAAKRPRPPLKSPIAKTDRHFVTALARGLEVLACFRH